MYFTVYITREEDDELYGLDSEIHIFNKKENAKNILEEHLKEKLKESKSMNVIKSLDVVTEFYNEKKENYYIDDNGAQKAGWLSTYEVRKSQTKDNTLKKSINDIVILQNRANESFSKLMIAILDEKSKLIHDAAEELEVRINLMDNEIKKIKAKTNQTAQKKKVYLVGVEEDTKTEFEIFESYDDALKYCYQRIEEKMKEDDLSDTDKQKTRKEFEENKRRNVRIESSWGYTYISIIEKEIEDLEEP